MVPSYRALTGVFEFGAKALDFADCFRHCSKPLDVAMALVAAWLAQIVIARGRHRATKVVDHITHQAGLI